MKDISKRPIGIFDSGIGGLTVVSEMMKHLPYEDLVYFGDTGRFPYGVRSPETIKKFSRQNTRFLLMHKVKYIIVACNTASAQALNSIKRTFDVPMIGVIEPGAEGAVSKTRNGVVGIIGTAGTVASSSYTKAIHRFNNKIRIISAAAPLFVALAEEGYINKPASRLIVKDHLYPLKKEGIDCLVLGCTHFPVLKNLIAEVLGKKVYLVDSAEWTVKAARKDLNKRGLINKSKAKSRYRYFVSDTPEKFIKVGSRFLGRSVDPAKKVDIEKY